MKRILGLDLGTNSIGWALINERENKQLNKIEAAGCRIIPMDTSVLGNFEKGNSVSQTAERTKYRATRRLHERFKLRRDRLNQVLREIGFLPEHYMSELDRYGKFLNDGEPKLPWKTNSLGEKEFLFRPSFSEMLADFKENQPDLLAGNKKIPYDWTIYYLRKKALTTKISKEELAWIILQFNQKRGYYQSRYEEVDNTNDDEKIVTAKVVDVVKEDLDKKNNKYWYKVTLDQDNLEYRAAFSTDISHWIGTERDFLVTTKKLRNGEVKHTVSFLPTIDEIEKMNMSLQNKMFAKIKIKTEKTIRDSNKTIGEYIYDNILKDPHQKIKGKLIRTVDRDFYRAELERILIEQSKYHYELKDTLLMEKCLTLLYPNNLIHINEFRSKFKINGFIHLLIDDIIFYQRPLRSKKTLIDNCPYERHLYKNVKTNEEISEPIKCIARSNPYFQEFRLWQFLSNLRLYQREKVTIQNDGTRKLMTDVDVTSEFLKNDEDYELLFEYINSVKVIEQGELLSKIVKLKKNKALAEYRWNYVEDKEYPGNETRYKILSGLKRAGIKPDILIQKAKVKHKEGKNDALSVEYVLWHILYSIKDIKELRSALHTFARKNGIDDQAFVDAFIDTKPFEQGYGAYSEKAIKKLLSVMRRGRYWCEKNIDARTKERIQKIIDGEYDENITDKIRNQFSGLTHISFFHGLSVSQACYIVYGCHSEMKDVVKWVNPSDIDDYLRNFRQHSLNNPIVEQIVLETLRVVRDLWKYYGEIDEIHVELGRDLKNPKDVRKRMTQTNILNENTNMRIKMMLMEFVNEEYDVEGVRPYSPYQQEILRIYEENALENLQENDKEYEFIAKISKQAQPSKSDIMRYKLWLEQKYQSPYTGEMIPLCKLFTTHYQIEHIIPQARYFDDSLSNKVICESAVNSAKGSKLGYEFIKECGGQIITNTDNKQVKVLNLSDYEDLIKRRFSGKKKTNLLLEDIPDSFVNRQLNDSRYISKLVKNLLSNIVREQDENGVYEQDVVSKNVISCNGVITDRLKSDWGLKDKWNELILPRFRRMGTLSDEQFVTTNREGHEIPCMPFNLQKGFSFKRIDHRHHAMDAIVIACTTRNHVNLLSNEAAKTENKSMRYQLSRQLRRYESVIRKDDNKRIEVAKEFIEPWQGFARDVFDSLQNIVISFKHSQRIINKTVNYYQTYTDKHGNINRDANGNPQKHILKQTNGDSWAIRKPLHKETFSGEINLRKKKPVSLKNALNDVENIVNKDLKLKLRELIAAKQTEKQIKQYFTDNKDVWSEVDLSKIEVYYFTENTSERCFANRVSLNTDFNEFYINKNVADSAVRKILLNYLSANNNDANVAFSPEGIERMNNNIKLYNEGKDHKPIYKVRKYEVAQKFAVGRCGTKNKKFVEAEKGTNLFFVVYRSIMSGNTLSERKYATIPLNVVINIQKKYEKDWRNHLALDLIDCKILSPSSNIEFILSPNDLVYLPTESELLNGIDECNIDKSRIYKMVSANGSQCFFLQNTIASFIKDKGEYTTSNKMEKAITGEMIKTICYPVQVDRLGNIKII